MLIIFLLFEFLTLIFCERTSSERNNPLINTDHENSWMYFPDDDGNPRMANLTEIEEHGKRIIKNVDEKVTLTLYTRAADCASVLKPNNKTLNESSFNLSKEVKILIHGWMSSENSPFLKNIKTAFLNATDYNIITVDWSSLAKNYFYTRSAKDTKLVGNYVGKIIKFLNESGADLDKIHCIGHSLGAHVCGIVGQFLEGKLRRITGLDPAKPYFFRKENNDRLDKSDAKFVDIIHSCGGKISLLDSLGHADFYPNGGTPAQPGCMCDTLILQEACSHSRAWQFYVISILAPRSFRAKNCSSWEDFKEGRCKGNQTVYMGENVNQKAFGNYYLWTSEKIPYRSVRKP